MHFSLCLLSLLVSHPPLFWTVVHLYTQNRTNMSHDHHHHLPCLHCHPHSFIRMVQHLIERCLLLRMSRDDCVKALATHANIKPLITLTVWKELLKENRCFFHSYFHAIPRTPFICRPSQRSPRLKTRQTWK